MTKRTKQTRRAKSANPRASFGSRLGKYYIGDVVKLLKGTSLKRFEGKIQLIVTSPPFPLNEKKSYGNLTGDDYLKWFTELAPLLSKLLTKNGSIVIEIGNAWEPHRPIQSLLPLKALMGFLEHKESKLKLCQEFVCYNPSRLPSPAAWVTTRRIRTVDSYTHVWWMAKSDRPKANNKRVLRPYSKSMLALLKAGKFNSGNRPSEHRISEAAFLRDCGGSISHNFLEIEPLDAKRELRLPNAFSFSNTSSNDYFSRVCKKKKIVPHPARMPMGLAAFFIQFLTTRGDRVFDPFGGTNTTGYVAERLGRKWLTTEISRKYRRQAQLRFTDPALKMKK